MKRTEHSGQAVYLIPGDELVITVDWPQRITWRGESEGTSVHVVKEWGELDDLRQEVRRLRGEVKSLTWHLRSLEERETVG